MENAKHAKIRTAGKQRVHWIDVAKGLGIILVSFGHIRNGAGESVWLPALNTSIDCIYLFHMPLFYFLGGLTFSSRRPFGDFLKTKAKTLLIPYYVFSLYFLAKPIASLMMPALSSGMRIGTDYASSVREQIYGILINGDGLWFLWAYFVGELIVYPINRKLRSAEHSGNFYTGIGLVLIIASVAFAQCFPNVTLPFRIVLGVEVAGFILLGIASRPLLKGIQNRWTVGGGLSVVMFAVFVLCAFTQVHASGAAAATLLRLVCMFLGVAAVVFLSICIYSNTVLEYLGRHSLSFYVVNALTMNIGKILFFKVLHIDGVHASMILQWLVGILLTAFCMGLMALEDLLIRALIPWSLGITRQKTLEKENDTI